MYGTQTQYAPEEAWIKFENDVKMYGTQTAETPASLLSPFENDVKMYGTQTSTMLISSFASLRMM